MLWLLLAGWVVLHVADWTTNAALLARGGVVALAGYKVLVIAGGVVVTWLGFRLWPRIFVVLMAVCALLVAAAVLWNTRQLILR